MVSPRKAMTRRLRAGRLALGTGLAIGWLVTSVGCQVEYAGMTLPSGKYMHDDVQYFPPGPHFPWANTQAAAQRARIAALGQEYGVPGLPAAPGGATMTPPPVPGTLAPTQNVLGRPTDINASPFSVEAPDVPAAPAPAVPPQNSNLAPGGVPQPGANPNHGPSGEVVPPDQGMP